MNSLRFAHAFKVLFRTMIREFFSDFTKIRRTPFVFLHMVLPAVVTILFFIYYASAGYRILSDVRMFFILLQISYPIFAGIVVPVFIHLDRKISNLQNALGLVESRRGVYLGKLLFLLFFSAIHMIIYELCFYAGANLFLDIRITNFGSCFAVFSIFLFSSLFLYLLQAAIAFRFGSSISVLAGISGTILAGFFETAIGDKIWPVIPWEWGVRFLEHYFGFAGTSVAPGIAALIVMTSLVLVLSILWFGRWEGKMIQE